MNSTDKITAEQKPKRSRKKIFLLGLGALGIGLLTFFSIHLFSKKNKQAKSTATSPKTNTASPPPPTDPKPKSATKAKAAPKQKESTTSNPPPKEKTTAKPINAPLLARAIFAMVLKKDFTKVFNLLKPIKSVNDYAAVNNTYKLLGLKQTLVTSLLTVFKDEKQKQAFRKAFTAMGLKYDGKKWSLSGLDGSMQIITTIKTQVWRDPQTAVDVPINMVLGREVCKRGKFTLFENSSQYFLVKSNEVKSYQS